MSELTEEEKKEIRKSEDYKTVKKILHWMFWNIVGLKEKGYSCRCIYFTMRVERFA